MGSRRLTVAVFLLLAASMIGSAWAGEPVEGKNNKVAFDGVVWSTYKYVLDDASPSNKEKDFNAFLVDRVYLTMTSQLGERYTARGRVEIGNQNKGSGTYNAFLKTADIQVADPFGVKGTKLRFGQTDGIVSNWYEKLYGFRISSRVPTDRLLGIGTAYLGVGCAGKWLDGMLDTDVLIANRVAYSADMADEGKANPKFKTFVGRAALRPIKEGAAKGFGIGGFAQYAPRTSPSADNNDMWFGGHVFYESAKATGAIAYDTKVSKSGGKDVTAALITAGGRYFVTEKDEFFARLDLVDFDKDNEDVTIASDVKQSDAFDKKLQQTFVVAGMAHSYSKTLRSVVDVTFRSFQDKLYQIPQNPENAPVEIKPDSEIVISLRLDATL
jgi:hypothetical protein